MTRPLLLVTRPAEEAGRTAEAAAAAGFATMVAPLLEIVPLPFRLSDGKFDAILFTSARAPALVAEAAPGLRAWIAHAVGARTAEEAAASGFRTGLVGDSDGSAILAELASGGPQRILHLAGEASAPLHVPAGIELVRVAVYAAQRVAGLPADVLAALQGGHVLATTLFSARTARHFRRLAEGAGLDLRRLRIVAMSPAVAEAAGGGWAAVSVARKPDLARALAAARALWQGDDDGR